MKLPALLQQITPLPWRYSTIALHEPDRVMLLSGERQVAFIETRSLHPDQDEADLTYLTHAANVLPDLVKALTAAEERIRCANAGRTKKQGHFMLSDIQSALAKATEVPD
jgi:hypothetical protein